MRPTPEATIGPFYPGAFVAQMPDDLWTVSPLVAHHPQGQRIVWHARFVDVHGRGVPSLIVEVWQANAHGRYRHPADRSTRPLDPQFDAFARLRTSDEGRIHFSTIKPGSHPAGDDQPAMRAPHLRLTIFASGIDRLITHVFFDDEPLNQADPMLTSISDPRVRARLISARRPAPHPAEVPDYDLDRR